ncbi:ArsR family transcriptional regulator [Streptomyces capoamus]|uniref:ArsR family transcriptional regulator n=1 Tax=Streptomyces capoamus TaxID=68183 RepID=A0A919F1T9_9ACTN|nr:winged helix-turn-helix domain-containing protein [Streptomyces capoamus]GGW20275.1 ArsR family transcriptional regulator [Streptomyces libani subsp. rufus]GHG70091.1 ArsR family transcriptional regulator [Streptomyces capoamus]
MIRIHLGPEGLGNVRICGHADFDAELTAAGRALAHGGRSRLPLAQLYSRGTSPDLTEGVDHVYLSHLFARRRPTPFTKALAEGDERAYSVLATSVDRLRSTAVDPHRSGISSAVAARAADLSPRYVASGASAMLHRLGHDIRFRPGVVEVPTAFEGDLELGIRSLRIQPVALNRQVTLAEPTSDSLTIRIPAGNPPRLEPEHKAALRSLLGEGRAEVLAVIVTSGDATGRQLARQLGVSDAAVSRYTTVLRQAGLIQTRRIGQAVKHIATPLGHHLAQPHRSPL